MAEKVARGFALLDPEKHRELASKGGKAVHAKGKGHAFTSEEARIAGKKGGEATSRNKEHMSRLGHLGGTARAAQRKGERQDPEVA